MKWYEIQIGLYVESETESGAVARISDLLRSAELIDPEGDAQLEVVAEWPVGGPVRT